MSRWDRDDEDNIRIVKNLLGLFHFLFIVVMIGIMIGTILTRALDTVLLVVLFIAALIFIALLPHIITTTLKIVLNLTGWDVNRKLDPVEAAVLMRVAPGRILTMIMFGLMKKGNVKLTSVEPVRLEIVSRKGLNYYEKLFVDAIRDDQPQEPKLLDCFYGLAQSVLRKTQDRSRERTEAFYRDRIAEVWNDLEAVDTPEVRQRKFDENLLWLMADDDYARKISEDLGAQWEDKLAIPVGDGSAQRLDLSAQLDFAAASPYDLETRLASTSERSFKRSVFDSVETISSDLVKDPIEFIKLLDFD